MATTAPRIRRLLPQPVTTTTIAAAYGDDRPSSPDRPWLGLCMVASLDGSVAVDGTSGGLGNQNDLDVLLTLRAVADMLIVGAGTARGEGYGPPKKTGQRIGVVTNSGGVDLDGDLFTSGAGFVVTAASTDLGDTDVDVLRAGIDEVDIAEAVSRLHEIMPGVRHVQAEGGPHLNGSLLDADLVDELAVTISPRLVGGDGPRLTAGAHPTVRNFRLAHLLADDEGFIFGRYLRDR
ncbi:MAG: dihydrofolate reductase family protein [Ilumatobacteraceae bacterium]